MKRIFSSRKKHINSFVAIFLLAFASVFTFFFLHEGWTFAEGNTVPQKFEIKWTSPSDGEYLTYDNEGTAILKPTNLACYSGTRGCSIKMNVGFIAGGDDLYPVESITLKIPKYIVKDRDGSYQGKWDIGLSKDKAGSTGFYYDDTSDPYYFIIRNFEEVSPTREVSFDIVYGIKRAPEIVDELVHNTT